MLHSEHFTIHFFNVILNRENVMFHKMEILFFAQFSWNVRENFAYYIEPNKYMKKIRSVRMITKKYIIYEEEKSLDNHEKYTFEV